MTLRTYSEAKSEIIRFFGSYEDSPAIITSKQRSLAFLSNLQEDDKVAKHELSGKEAELVRLRAELESDTQMEETERREKFHRCCSEIGSLRAVRATLLNFSLEFNPQEKSCEISPVLLPDYSERSDAFLSLFGEDLELKPKFCARVCVDERDNLYLASNGGKSISVYDRDIHFLRKFENELLNWPYSIAMGHQCLLVTEWDNRSLLKFSLGGELLGRVPQLKRPCGLAVTENDLVFVTCPAIIHVFTHELNLVTSFTSIPKPCDVKLANDNTLLVLDNGGQWLHWITLEGQHGKVLTGCTSNMLFFAVDRFDNVLLSDFTRGEIRVYSRDMRLAALLDNKKNKQTLQNRSLAVRHDGTIVCVSQREPFLNLF